jgi:ribosome-binding protein aMBF1 (putative translation factor)
MTTTMTCESSADLGVRSVVESRLQRMTPDEIADLQKLLSYLQNEEDEEDRTQIMRTLIEMILPESIRNLRLPVDEADEKRVRERLTHYRQMVGARIRSKRESLGWTQEQLADVTGLAQSHISRLEVGKHAPTFQTIERIAGALQVAAGDLDPGFPDE